MKSNDLTKKQKEELEKFGANTWFVESLHKQYEADPQSIPEQWRNFFGNVKGKDDGAKAASGALSANMHINYPQPSDQDEIQVIAGSSARILENMTNSLSIPVATSQRSIPVKLLEENRSVINQAVAKRNLNKISYTHLISWAILKSVSFYPSINNAFSIINGKPTLIKRKQVNLGLAIDVERKDGSRSLFVPNIKNANELNFKQFIEAYEGIVQRSRKGTIDPSEFLGTTITLTNPGTIGTNASIPRLMIGQGAIIATGAIQYSPEYQAMSHSTISALGVSKVMTITSTYDHRIIQGAESGLFLKKINELLLGQDNFYEEIFKALQIPLKPLSWKTDYQPGIFDSSSNTEEIEKQAKVLQLINLYRVRGHLIADLDPLKFKIPYHPELDPSSFNLTIWDLDRQFITGGFSGLKKATLREILNILQKTYCDKIGVEYMHIQNPAEKIWLQNQMEPVMNKPQFDKKIRTNILKKLIEAESFEHFVHKSFIGHKRFSLEGSETLIPVLDALLNEAKKSGISEVVLGMAHRGRLNVLTNIIGKSFESVFSEFEDIQDPNSIEGSGDVKYHLGASGKFRTYDGDYISVSVASNPSHLEWVNPVVEGIVRAKQNHIGESKTHRKIMPLLIHGDAAFAGQGICAETLNLSQLSGYRTGGTVHIVINNQIGFTTTPEDARSSVYATDVAKMIQAPIFHVNGDDVEASVWVTKLALEYRQIFNKDIVIDLFGYRRHGHNEGDEPGFTQPLLYEKIKQHPSVQSIYREHLLKEGTLSPSEVGKIQNEIEEKLYDALEKTKRRSSVFNSDIPLAYPKEQVEDVQITKDSSISENSLHKIIEGITTIPHNFNSHSKLKKFLDKRKGILDGTELADWALAEAIAFGSLLLEGTSIRLSGQDSVRGTFSQRHLALTDIVTGEEYFPINHISKDQNQIEALDSFLSEAAVLGFEYGFSTADPLALVMWEAQFGDFANGAQIIIDNFIAASYEKWKLPNSLVLLLPHGYEGQGPEHSSARLERFLILCAQDNMYVCNASTPAQYFHLLRRHIRQNINKPLIIMTPKSLLRHPEAKSPKADFLKGRFHEILEEDSVNNKNMIKRIILTSGKVFYDLAKFKKEHEINDSTIIRLEQIYPYKSKEMRKILASYTKAKDVVWVQEEPKNMGAWNFLTLRLIEDLSPGQKLRYAGRPESASPAVGSAKISNQQQKHLVKQAFAEG